MVKRKTPYDLNSYKTSIGYLYGEMLKSKLKIKSSKKYPVMKNSLNKEIK